MEPSQPIIYQTMNFSNLVGSECPILVFQAVETTEDKRVTGTFPQQRFSAFPQAVKCGGNWL